MCALEHLGVKREGLLCTSDAETIPSIKKIFSKLVTVGERMDITKAAESGDIRTVRASAFGRSRRTEWGNS